MTVPLCLPMPVTFCPCCEGMPDEVEYSMCTLESGIVKVTGI